MSVTPSPRPPPSWTAPGGPAPATWRASCPPWIFVNGRTVRVGRFASALDPHAIALVSYTAGRWNLLVVPPETEALSTALMTAERPRLSGRP